MPNPLDTLREEDAAHSAGIVSYDFDPERDELWAAAAVISVEEGLKLRIGAGRSEAEAMGNAINGTDLAGAQIAGRVALRVMRPNCDSIAQNTDPNHSPRTGDA